MYAFKVPFGRCQQLRQVASALSIPWHQQLSSSTVRADVVDEEVPAFGLLSSDLSSKFYEKKKGQGKSYLGHSLPFNDGQSKMTEEDCLSSRRQKSRQTNLNDRNSFTPASTVHKSFHQGHSHKKWLEIKRASNEEVHNLSQDLVADDYEKDYVHGELEPRLFNKRLENRKRNNAKVNSSVDEGSQKLVASSKAQIQPDEEPFGQLSSQKNFYDYESGDEGDKAQEKYEEAMLQHRHKPAYYGNQMKKLCRERKLADALHILEKEMPAVGVKPDEFCYQVLINACGRAGYTKKAFQLYNNMKKRRLNVQPVAYTGLFNACANSPWQSQDGLVRAHKLRKQLQENGYVFNQTNSHAMIKAFGRCGDIKTAFLIVDEMLEQGLIVDTETICFMLQACITDKETGFRHALMVWRKMREIRLCPSIYSYNLMIHCLKDCNAGDPLLTKQLLDSGYKPSKNRREENNVTPPKETSDTMQEVHEGLQIEDSKNVANKVEILSRNDKLAKIPREVPGNDVEQVMLPNLLAGKMTVGSVVGLSSLKKPEDRLALLGGPSGLIEQMLKDRVTPDLKTFTHLIDALPPDLEAEESLIRSMKNIGLTPDTQFCNMLLRKRSFRYDGNSAKDVLNLMQEHSLQPDLITFGCLALTCKTWHDASELLSDIDAAGFRPNLEIMTALVKNSFIKQNFHYTHELLREIHYRGLSPCERLISILEQCRNKARQIVIKMDSRKEKLTIEEKKRLHFIKIFLFEYKNWLKRSKVQLDDHPWAQYKLSEQKEPVES